VSTRIEVKYVCDRCQADDLTQEDIKSFHVTSKALGKAEYEFDLCSKCSIDFQADYLPFVKFTKRGTYNTPTNPHPCTYPGCTYVGKNNGSLGVHKGKSHPGFSQQERLEQAASKGVPCTEEGCDFVAISEKGLKHHMRQSPLHQVLV
jgi:hypothetical protein